MAKKRKDEPDYKQFSWMERSHHSVLIDKFTIVQKPDQQLTPIPQIQQPIVQQQVQEIIREEKEMTPIDNGAVFLVWKDNANQQVVNEVNRFPTKGSLYIVDFKDYETEEQMIDAVESYQRIIDDYKTNVHNASGVYRIVMGKIVAGVKKTIAF